MAANRADKAAAEAGLKRDENESDDALMDRVRLATWVQPDEHEHGEPLILTALDRVVAPNAVDVALNLKPRR